MIKKYYYYVVYVFGYGGIGACDHVLNHRIKSWSDIQLIREQIINDYNLSDVVITNWKLFRVTRVKKKVK